MKRKQCKTGSCPSFVGKYKPYCKKHFLLAEKKRIRLVNEAYEPYFIDGEPPVAAIITIRTFNAFPIAMQRYFRESVDGNWVCTNCKKRVKWDDIKEIAEIVFCPKGLPQ